MDNTTTNVQGREIKFRAFDDGKMVYSDYFDDDRNYSEWDYLAFFFKNIRSDAKVMRFTGIRDKNGVEIYQSDIIKVINYDLIDAPEGGDKIYEDCISSIEYIGTSFQFKCFFGETQLDPTCQTIEVIGNIYEHPHLLKGEPSADRRVTAEEFLKLKIPGLSVSEGLIDHGV